MAGVEQSSTNEELLNDLHPEVQYLLAPFLHQQPTEDRAEIHSAEVLSQTTKLLRSYYTPVTSNQQRYVLDFLEYDLPQPQHIGSQFVRWLHPAFISADVEIGLSRLRQLVPVTQDQSQITSTSDEQFEKVWVKTNEYLQNHHERLVASVEERFATDTRNGHNNRSSFRNNDFYQFRESDTVRSLGAVLRTGLTVTVDTAGTEILARTLEESQHTEVPLTELVKNWPILSISGFAGSKLSLAIHDALDHVWTFALAEKKGLLAKYDALFKSIGMPHKTDIFKREGEILASISFGARYWEKQKGFIPLINTNQIKEHLLNLLDSEQISPHHARALNIVLDLLPDSEEYESLGFVFSNYLVTLHEQRRRYGSIKQHGVDNNELLGELSPISADFLCFLIELHHEIVTSPDRTEAMDSVHASLEGYLQSIAKGDIDIKNPLVLHPDHRSTESEKLSETIESWLRKNYKFSTIKEKVQHA